MAIHADMLVRGRTVPDGLRHAAKRANQACTDNLSLVIAAAEFCNGLFHQAKRANFCNCHIRFLLRIAKRIWQCYYSTAFSKWKAGFSLFLQRHLFCCESQQTFARHFMQNGRNIRFCWWHRGWLWIPCSRCAAACYVVSAQQKSKQKRRWSREQRNPSRLYQLRNNLIWMIKENSCIQSLEKLLIQTRNGNLALCIWKPRAAAESHLSQWPRSSIYFRRICELAKKSRNYTILFTQRLSVW